MAHTTTSTSTYALAKYSRSYPTSSSPQDATLQWQHFTNPVLRALLDVRKSGNILESVKLRIVWTMNPADSNNSDVFFEDLELLSFSTLPSKQLRPAVLPLKAVYRDALVGFRYAYPYPSAHTAYRRFQITFANPTDVVRFTDVISTVCPCKQNIETNKSGVSEVPGVQSHPYSHAPIVRSALEVPIDNLNATQSSRPSAFSNSRDIVPTGHPAQVRIMATAAPTLTPSQVVWQPDATEIVSQDTQARIPNMNYEDFLQQITAMVSTNLRSNPQDVTNHTQQLSNSSPPESSPRITSEDLAPVLPSSSISFNEAMLGRGNFHPHSASAAELESIVAEVIHDASFQELLEKIDALWRVKLLCNVPL